MKINGKYATDCKYYNGYKPCANDGKCRDCPQYVGVGNTAIVFRVNRLGNLVKSLPIAKALRISGADHITWVTRKEAIPLFDGNPYVDEVIEYGWETSQILRNRVFDTVVVLEADPGQAALGKEIFERSKEALADQKPCLMLGYSINEYGKLVPANEDSEYYVGLGVSDRFRFSQRQDYHSIVLSLTRSLLPEGKVVECGEPWIRLTDEERKKGFQTIQEIVRSYAVVVGLAIGGDNSRFPTKEWPLLYWVELYHLLTDEGMTCIFLAGPQDSHKVEIIMDVMGPKVNIAPHSMPIRDFCATINGCDVVVAIDSFAMHAAAACGHSGIVGIFGPTPYWEAPLEGRSIRLNSGLDCAPCYNQGVRGKKRHRW